MDVHFRTCSLCEAMCGVRLEHENGRVLSVRGDDEDVFSRGHICPKAVALQDVHEDPDRLRQPMRRRGSDWETLGWDEALDAAAGLLAGVQQKHGRHALAVYQGNPVVHSYSTILFGQVLLRALHTRSHFSASSLDQMPHQLAQFLMYGHQLLFPVPDVDHTRYFFMLGANPVASNGSLMTAPGIRRRLLDMRARGGKLVVVDPRRTETAAIADEHVPIRPGTDALLLLAMLQVLDQDGAMRLGALAPVVDGLEDLRAAVRAFTPESVAGPTGIPADTIRRLAREFAAAEPAVAYGRMGVSTQAFGATTCWLVNVLNAVTGNLDRPGGSAFPAPAADLAALGARLGLRGSYARRRSRVSQQPEVGGEWPTAILAEEIDTVGEGQIRGLLTIAGNPVLSSPNGRRLERALAGLEAMVSVDSYLNETSRHAHLILPPASPLERDHYDLVFHALAVRNTARHSPPLFEPAQDARHDWQILLGLTQRMQSRRGARLTERASTAVAAQLGPRGILDLLLRTGPYGPRLGFLGSGLTLARLEKQPHGVDLGPLQPRLVAAMEGRRVQLAPKPFLEDLTRVRRHVDAAPPLLALIGRRDLRSNNSWLHNIDRLVKGPERCTLLMHPDDASSRGLVHGAQVRVTSRVGAVECPLQVSPDISPGVVSLPHGWGHHREGTRLAVAGARPGTSLNDLTDDAFVDTLSGNAAFNGVPVEVAAL